MVDDESAMSVSGIERPGTATFHDLRKLVERYDSPSEAYWRFFELKALRTIHFQRPILELGCGDGVFTGMLLDEVEDAIDVNRKAVERSLGSRLYGRVRCLDARALSVEAGSYGTVYANCVLEHIPDLGTVLQSVRTALRPGGKLVATVPLRDMDECLMVSHPRYAELRRRQLKHVNLLDVHSWSSLLRRSGFAEVRMTPYLYASQCRLWDSVDVVACLGLGRYRVGAAYRLGRHYLLPRFARSRLDDVIARQLWTRLGSVSASSRACAVLIEAS